MLSDDEYCTSPKRTAYIRWVHDNISKELTTYMIEGGLTPELNTIRKKYPLIAVYRIHKDEDLCFNSEQRELLYTFQDCFTEINGSRHNSVFKESTWGKCLVILEKTAPEIPPFKNWMKYYKKHYIDRLTLLDQHFEKYDQDDFNYKKSELKFKKKWFQK